MSRWRAPGFIRLSLSGLSGHYDKIVIFIFFLAASDVNNDRVSLGIFLDLNFI
jgi:hypothetical protein